MRRSGLEGVEVKAKVMCAGVYEFVVGRELYFELVVYGEVVGAVVTSYRFA